MKKAILLGVILFVSIISTACINNFAVQELNNKAKVYLEKGDFDNAISRLKSSIDLDSTIFETHYNLGIAYTQAGKYSDAIETFKNAIKLKPDFADTYYSLGVAQENFAKGIIDGELNIEGQSKKEKGEALNESYINTAVNLTPEEHLKINELYTEAIFAYTKYLEKGKDVADKKDVESKIEYLNIQKLKYSAQPQQGLDSAQPQTPTQAAQP